MQEPFVVRTFRGHRDIITSLAFSPNLKYMASSSCDASICIWDLQNEKNSFKLVGHKGEVNEVTYSPNGALLASCSRDNTIKIWNARPDGKFSTLRGHAASVNSVDFSRDTSQLLSASDDLSLLLWDIAEGVPTLKLEGHTGAINSARLSSDSKIAISCGNDGQLNLWEIERQTQILTFGGAEMKIPIYATSIHPDETCVGAAFADGFFRIYDIRSKKLIAEYRAHVGGINGFDFHKNTPLVVTGGADAQVKLFDIGESLLKTTLRSNEISTTCVKFSPEGDYFACGGEDNTCVIWKTNIVDMGLEKIPKKSQSIATINSQKRITNLAPKPVEEPNYSSALRDMTRLPQNVPLVYSHPHKPQPQTIGADCKYQSPRSPGPTPSYVLPESMTSKLTSITSSLTSITSTLSIMSSRISNTETLLDGLSDYIDSRYPQNLN